MDEVAWDAATPATHPDLVRGMHEDYIEAGAVHPHLPHGGIVGVRSAGVRGPGEDSPSGVDAGRRGTSRGPGRATRTFAPRVG
jgi:hypothetical protein